MRIYALAAALACILLMDGAIAQPSSPPLITPQQRDVIRMHIVQEGRTGITMPPDLVPAIGTRMPESVALFWMPRSAGLNRMRYTLVNQTAFVVDYQDRRVVEILAGPQ